jgi:acetyl esterase/lipase
MIFIAGYSGPKWPGLLWVLASFFVLFCGVLTQFPIISERGLYVHLALTEDQRSIWLLSIALLIWPAWRNLKGGAPWFCLPLLGSVLISLPLIQSGRIHSEQGCKKSFKFIDWLTRSAPSAEFYTVKHQADSSELAIIYPAKTANSPLVFLLHGGGFYQGHPSYMHGWCAALSASGITAVSLAYPLEPNAIFPAPEDSIVSRIRRLKPHLASKGADTSKIFIGGSSAGATLAISTAARHTYFNFRGIVALYPLASLCNNFNTIMDLKRVEQAYVGLQDCNMVELTQRVKFNMPPLLLMHGENDNVVPIEQSMELYSKYFGKKRFVVIPWAGHNFEYPIYGPSGQLVQHLSEDFIVNPIVR